jgi:hypothetical protein
MEEITLIDPAGLVVLKQTNKAACGEKECHNKELYWSTVKKSNKKMLISRLPTGEYIQHFKDCPGRSNY